jgi:hypothetical protein
MRFRHQAILGILLVLLFCLSVSKENVSGQPAQIDNAQSKLVQAFVLVQQADIEGASPGQISMLANNLNLALAYEDNATRLFPKDITASNFYASMSASLSNATSAQALSVASAARTQALFNQAVAYSLAVSAALGSALLALEVHRLDDLVRRMRLRRMRLD